MAVAVAAQRPQALTAVEAGRLLAANREAHNEYCFRGLLPADKNGAGHTQRGSGCVGVRVGCAGGEVGSG